MGKSASLAPIHPCTYCAQLSQTNTCVYRHSFWHPHFGPNEPCLQEAKRTETATIPRFQVVGKAGAEASGSRAQAGGRNAAPATQVTPSIKIKECALAVLGTNRDRDGGRPTTPTTNIHRRPPNRPHKTVRSSSTYSRPLSLSASMKFPTQATSEKQRRRHSRHTTHSPPPATTFELAVAPPHSRRPRSYATNHAHWRNAAPCRLHVWNRQ